jgi:hypothetical protein
MTWAGALCSQSFAPGGSPRRVQQLKLAVALAETLWLMSQVASVHTAESRRAAEEG